MTTETKSQFTITNDIILSDKGCKSNTDTDNQVNLNVNSKYKHLNKDELKQLYKTKTKPFAVGCINLLGDINIGMMIRTSLIYSAQEFYVFGRKKLDRRSTVGYHHHIPMNIVKCVEDGKTMNEDLLINTINSLKKEYTIVFIEQNDTSIQLNKLQDYKKVFTHKPPLFIFGTESDGIPKRVVEECYKHMYTDSDSDDNKDGDNDRNNVSNNGCLVVEIPQFDTIGRSLNVSVACGIVLWEYCSRCVEQ